MSLYQLAPSLQPLRGLAYLWQIFYVTTIMMLCAMMSSLSIYETTTQTNQKCIYSFSL